MRTWKIVYGVALLAAVSSIYILNDTRPKPYTDFEFEARFTASELDGLAATQVDCSWPYELTEKGVWLHRRFDAQKTIDDSLQERFNHAMANYQNLTQDEKCAFQEQFPELLRRWHD